MGNMLMVIHEIVHQTDGTVVYLDDVLLRLFSRIINARSSMERLTAVAGVSKARWFKCMWAALESVCSRAASIMAADFHLFVKTGDQIIPPIHARPSLKPQENSLWAKFEAVGVVRMILDVLAGFGNDGERLREFIYIPLILTGLELEPFATIGSYMYS